MSLEGSRIVVGVTGGIAAYKAAELVRELRREGALVRVIMTRAAQAFITPLTFEALTGQPVGLDDHEGSTGPAMLHIDLARWAQRVLVAPATADLMARLAAGLADDLLTTLCLAYEGPLILAPAMNQAMWRHPATQSNRAVLCSRGVQLLGPEAGEQACGDVGPGRMLEPWHIVTALKTPPSPGPLQGLRVMLTAGPTREPIDPVRFLSNRSSGKMGYALAKAAREAGAEVTLISGPTPLKVPHRVERVEVETAAEMAEAVQSRLADMDLFIAAAAVADYSPVPSAQKIKKEDQPLTLTLNPSRDILKWVSQQQPRPFCVGFAAETEDLENKARSKLIDKSLDLILANTVGPDLGFDQDENAILALWPEGKEAFPKAHKTDLANRLIQLIGRLYHASHPTQDS